MKKYLPIVFLFTIYNSIAQVTFQERSSYATSSAIDRTYDGGYVIGGITGAPYGNVFTMKISSLGNLVWANTFTGNNDGAAIDIIEANDEGIISTGFYTSPSGPSGGISDLFLQKTDNTGGLLWMKLYGGNNEDRGMAVRQLVDHGFIIAGWTNNSQFHNFIYLIRTDSSGTMVWNKLYDDNSISSSATSIAITADGGYTFTGYYFNSNDLDIILVKTDSAGNVTWSKKFGTSLSEVGKSIQQTADGGFVVAGYYGADPNGNYAFLLKTDNSGNLLWAKKYHFTNQNQAIKVIVTLSGKFLLTGYCSTININDSKIFAFLTDSIGNVIWSKTYGITGDKGTALVRADDGGYVLTGAGLQMVNTFPIVKIDSMGNSSCNDSNITVISDTIQLVPANLNFTISSVGSETSLVPTSIASGSVTNSCLNNFIFNYAEKLIFNVYPNPANDQIRIACSDFIDKYSITIFNSIGQRIIDLAFENDHEVIDTKMLPSGFYSVVVNNGSGSFAKKLMVAH